MSSEFYIIGGKEQRHSNEMTMVWKPRGESVVFPEYEGKVCGFCCRNCTWEQVLEFGVPGDVKVKVRKGTDIFDTHESFACVSGRMKCFLLSVDDSLEFRPFPQDDFHVVIPATCVTIDVAKTGGTLEERCRRCSTPIYRGPMTVESLEKIPALNRIFRIDPDFNGCWLYCSRLTKDALEKQQFNGLHAMRVDNMSQLDRFKG